MAGPAAFCTSTVAVAVRPAAFCAVAVMVVVVPGASGTERAMNAPVVSLSGLVSTTALPTWTDDASAFA